MSTVTIPKGVLDPYYRYKREIIKTAYSKKSGGTTFIVNAGSISKSLYRDIADIVAFLGKKLGCNVINCDSKDSIAIRGVFNQETLESCIEEYAEKHVICKYCSLPEIRETHESHKIRKKICHACGSMF